MSKSRWLGNNGGGTKDARRGTRNEERRSGQSMRYSRSARDRTSRDATMSQRKKEKRLSEGNGDLQRSSKKQQQKNKGFVARRSNGGQEG